MAILKFKSANGYFHAEQYISHDVHFYLYYSSDKIGMGKIIGRIHIRKNCINLDADVDTLEAVHFTDFHSLIKQMTDGCKKIQAGLPDENV